MSDAETTTDSEPEADERTATVEVESDHAPEDVWGALTTDDGLARWMGTGATIEPEVDGSIEAPDPATGRHRRGQIDRVETGERLGFTWWPIDDPDDTSVVTIELEPTVEGTRIRVTETAKASLGPMTALRTRATNPSTVGAAWAWRAALLMVVGVCYTERERVLR